MQDLVQQILSLVEASIEDTRVPDAIAAHADKRAGKPVTKTDADQLEALLGVPVRISRQFKMTHIQWGMTNDEWRSGRQNSILIAHKDTNVNWPTGDELRTKEPAYFGARDKRNEDRKKLLGNHSDYCRTSLSIIERAAAAVLKLREAQEELQKLLDYGEPLHVVRSDVEKLVKEDQIPRKG